MGHWPEIRRNSEEGKARPLGPDVLNGARPEVFQISPLLSEIGTAGCSQIRSDSSDLADSHRFVRLSVKLEREDIHAEAKA